MSTSAAPASPTHGPRVATALVALVAGALFALGLTLSGMTQPGKILGFLDVSALLAALQAGTFPGPWDPSLAFVMLGAVAVTLVAFAVTPSNNTRSPWLAPGFELPTRRDIDRPLVVGAVIFGVGWGLSGYCPGPALAAALTPSPDLIGFLPAMLVGMWVARKAG